jgi:hypothetical protein
LSDTAVLPIGAVDRNSGLTRSNRATAEALDAVLVEKLQACRAAKGLRTGLTMPIGTAYWRLPRPGPST